MLVLTLAVIGILGVVSLSNPNPSPESGSVSEPVAAPTGNDYLPVSPEPLTIPPAPQPEPTPDPGPVQARGSAQDVIAQVKPSVVLVIAARPEGIGSGTGFVVSNNQVATCNHVVQNAARLVVITSDGRQSAATVTAADGERDVAVLTCSGTLPPPLLLGDSDRVRDGDEIAVTGFPVIGKFLDLGFEPTASTTRGTVSASRRREVENGVEVEELQIDASINPGNSGGPVYSSKDGTVIAIASSKLEQEQGIGFAVSINTLRRLLGR
jgi:S1-C subfamily serine protease